ncbi:unnamed protein product [Cladocopium goreaui]|uniref:EF-hand domain-containing protein n=1 Tax=Cladocopium goreaui TaxID=2562237 RepID=A0A9P1CJ92_9DINO|nr:unnamed protein product [Cladocopium goreaui]
MADGSDSGRASRLEELAKRARSLRAQLDRRVRGEVQGVESYLDRADLSGVAAASLELIDAADPLRAGHGDAPAAACEKTMRSGMETAPISAPEPRTSSSDVLPQPGGAGRQKRMNLTLEAVELAPSFAASMAKRIQLLLRCIIPRLESGTVTQEVVVAPCEKGRPGSSLSMLHCGHSSLHLVNTTLAEQPVLQLLASHGTDCPQTPDAESFVPVASGEIPWLLWEEAMRRGPVRVSLLAAAGPHERPAVVGCVLVTVRNAEIGGDALLDTSPIHLKVWLENFRFSQSLPTALEAVYIVAKLGRDQEIVAHLAKEGQYVEGGELVAPIALSAVAEEPCWRVDVDRQILVSGPVPEKLFLQVWRGQELLGLAGLPVPVLTKKDMAGLSIPGRPCVEVTSENLTVAATAATGTGDTFGVIRVKVCAEMVSSRQLPSPAVDTVAPEKDLLVRSLQQELVPTDPENIHPQYPHGPHVDPPPPVSACVELTAPLSNREVATWFGHLFRQTVSSALKISPGRIHIASIDGLMLMFEIRSGRSDEATPSEAAEDFARQISSESALAHSELAPFLALPRFAAKVPPQEFGSSVPLQSRISLPGEHSASCSRPLACTAYGPVPQAPDGLEEMLSAVRERLFEVVLASGVEPDRAFSVLDRDGDGIVAMGDVVALLHHLGLPLTQEVLSLPVQAGFSEADFRRHFLCWLQSNQPQQLPLAPAYPSWEDLFMPHQAAGERCLLLPDFLLFAMLDREGTGQLKPGIWHAFASRCLGLGKDAAFATYSFCDQHDLGAVSYRDFRRYIARVHDLRVQRMPEAAMQLDAICQDARAVLELAELPTVAVQTVQEPGRLAAVSDALGRRGCTLDSKATPSGLEELLSDLRLPSHIAGSLLRWQESISVALSSYGLQAEPPPLTYRMLLGILRASRGLVQTHLDALCGACMLSGIEMKLVLDFALRRPTQALSAEELAGALMAAGVDLKAVDPKDVLLALDPHGCKQIFAPDLIKLHENFLGKFEGLLSKMAGCIGDRQLSPDQLFPDGRLASFVSTRQASCR